MSKEIHFKIVENAIRSKQWVPVYFFYGEESYYIDHLIAMLLQSVLNETERNFNQIVFYGSETNVATIIHTCRKYPMVGKKQLILVKEMQDLKQMDDLIYYIQKPLLSTILVLYYRHGKLDGSKKKLVEEIGKIGTIFESKRLYDSKVQEFIADYLRKRTIGINVQTMKMVTDYLGNDLRRIANELDKLIVALPTTKRDITLDFFKKNSKITKSFNLFELQKALAKRDILKSNRIAWNFEQNFKKNPLTLILNTLFVFFVNLTICFSEQNRSKENLMNVLELKWDFQVIDYLVAIKQYDLAKTKKNIALIRETDAKSKGIKNCSVTHGQLLIELIYKLLH